MFSFSNLIYPLTNPRKISALRYSSKLEARALQQPSRCSIMKISCLQAVGCSCIGLYRGLVRGTAPLLCWFSSDWVFCSEGHSGYDEVGHTLQPSKPSATSNQSPGDFVPSYISVCLCLLRRRLSARYWGAAALLFILLLPSSHKVNCWDNLYSSKHLKDITSLAKPISMVRTLIHTCVCLESWHHPNLRVCYETMKRSNTWN